MLRRLAPLALALGVLVAHAAEAQPSDAEQKAINDACETSYEDAQRGQNADHLLDAKAAYGRCAAENCPKAVRAECSKALTDLEPNIPTAVFDSVDENGAQLIATKVTLDGHAVATAIDGHTLLRSRSWAAP